MIGDEPSVLLRSILISMFFPAGNKCMRTGQIGSSGYGLKTYNLLIYQHPSKF